MAADQLSLTFAALADPTRRAILERLAAAGEAGQLSVKELARPFAISAPAVTKHLKALQRAGLITRSRRAQWRPCQLDARPLAQAATWIDQYRQHWDDRLDRLDAYLRELQEKEKGDGIAD